MAVDMRVTRKRRSGTPRPRFLWKLRPYFGQVAGLLVIGSIGGIVMNLAIVLPAVLLGRAVNVVLALERHRATTTEVGWAALAFVGGTAATEVPRIAKRYWLGVARTRILASIRSDALRGVLESPTERSAAIAVGDVMARVIGDVTVLGTGVGEVVVETWDTLLFSVSLVVTMFIYDPVLAALALAPVPVALLFAKAAGRMVSARTTLAREAEAGLTGALREQLGALRLLRVFGRTESATEGIQALSEIQARAELATIRLDEALAAAYTVLLSAGLLFIVWRGGERVIGGSMSVGALVAFLALFVRFVTRAPRIPQMANRVQAAGAAYQRLEPLLATPLPTDGEPRFSSFRSSHIAGSSLSPEAPATRPPGPVGIRFVRASFTYPGSAVPALIEAEMEIASGAFVAVTGPVGSGKSALARLAAGLSRPGTGSVEIGGAEVADLDPGLRAATVGYIGQEPHVFSGTVAENVTLWAEREPNGSLGPAARRAVDLADLDRDLESMPNGPATEIGELGIRISGGQRQRIALARAIAASVRAPGLLVLDDPFSAVDMQTEAAILAGLRGAFGPEAPEHERATILLCSHRLAAFPLADLVVVLNAGRVGETGTHEELLARGGPYARIARAQARIGDIDALGKTT
ncbi:MAG: ABC transporter ATP-binding protein [Acidimicrobiales bacterium]